MNDNDQSEISLNYLPATVAVYFSDAIGCYRQGLLQAFAAMCRLTTQAVCDDLGDGTKLKLYDQVEEIAGLAGINDLAYRNIRNILFDTDNESLLQLNGMDRETAAVLLETMNDILHQSYIRRSQLRRKLRMRRLFANQGEEQLDEPDEDKKVSSFRRSTGTR